MAAAEDRDGRNFRQSYYEKVGFKGVEEKRSLEMILNERPLDLGRLTHFAFRFSLPDLHRERVWLLLLGCPPSPESGDFIANEQRQLSHDLEDALHVMGMHSHKREERGRILSMMYLLETGHLRPALLDQQLQSAELQPLYTIACNLTVNQCFKNDYWILKEFIKLICRIDKDEVRERVRADLAVEEPLLFDRLKDTASLSVIPCDLWLNCCFAGIICQPFLIKVWDKLVAGSAYKVMSLVGKTLIKFLKDDLFNATDEKQIRTILVQTLPPNKSESLVKEVMNQLLDV